ncbi:MAG: hypothetical protein RLN96_13630, partial [Pseudomonadales bacterium]
MHICQAVSSALMLKCESFVVYTQQVQQRSLEIMHVHAILRNVVAEVISFSVDSARFDASPGHPHRETPGVMISAVVSLGQCALGKTGPSELPSPNYKG